MRNLFVILSVAVGLFFSVEFIRAVIPLGLGIVEHCRDDIKKGLKILLNAVVLFIIIIVLAKMMIALP